MVGGIPAVHGLIGFLASISLTDEGNGNRVEPSCGSKKGSVFGFYAVLIDDEQALKGIRSGNINTSLDLSDGGGHEKK